MKIIRKSNFNYEDNRGNQYFVAQKLSARVAEQVAELLNGLDGPYSDDFYLVVPDDYILDLDRTLVTEGYPNEPGIHLLWSDQNGWPVLDLVQVQVTDSRIVWWKGTGGTDREYDISKMFGFSFDQYLGSSRATPEAFSHYEVLWKIASEKVRAMLADSGFDRNPLT